jgi:hypothetical protein
MATITAPEFPGERLIVCRYAELAADRTRTRQDPTECELRHVPARVRRKWDLLRGAKEIALEVGKVVNTYKVAEPFELDITATAFSPIDGIYIIRTSLPAAALDDAT